MATRGIVPRADGEGSIGTEKKRWGAAFFDKVAVKTLEVIGSGTENDAQPATVGWVKQTFANLLRSALASAGVRHNIDYNGYICLGSLFGNAILQWGVRDLTSGWDTDSTGPYIDVPYNIAMSSVRLKPLCVFHAKDANNIFVITPEQGSNTPAGHIRYRRVQIKGTQVSGAFHWFMIGIA